MKRFKTEDPQIIKYESGTFYFRKGDKEISLKTKIFKEAVRNKSILLSEGDIFLRASLSLSVKDVYPLYLKARESEVKAGKIRESSLGVMTDLMRLYLLPHFGKQKIAKITTKDWDKFVEKLELKDMSNVRRVFSHFIKWTAKRGYRNSLIFFDIPQPKRRKRRILKQHEIAAILANSNGYLHLFITIALTMGLRRTEIMTLAWDRVNLDEKWLFLPASITKTKRDRYVPLSKTVFKLLSTLERKGAYVFPNALRPKTDHMHPGGLKGSWSRVKERAFGKQKVDITWNDFRATCEYYAHKRTDLTDTQLQKFFGSNIEVQREIYVSFNADDVRGVEDSLSLPAFKPDMGRTRGRSQDEE